MPLDKAPKTYYISNTNYGTSVFGIWDIGLFNQQGAQTNMKIKTSITLSEEIVKEIDELSSQYGNRSLLIEKAIKHFLAAEAKRRRDLQDVAILNRSADALNKEAEDVLVYQVDL
jgi:Arc/MetJ-type ribon-helix-helix transcriptional regulator